VVYLAEFKFVYQIVSKLSEFMLEVLPYVHGYKRVEDDDATG